jgi:hypothetical protein
MTFFDGSDVDEKVLDNLGTLPDGDYKVVTSEVSKEWSTKSPGVGFCKCVFEVVEGDFMGRKIFSNFIFKHPSSDKAVEIGRARFKLLCLAALGSAVLESEQELYGKPIYLQMKTRTSKKGGSSFDIQKISSEPFAIIPVPQQPGGNGAYNLEDIF